MPDACCQTNDTKAGSSGQGNANAPAMMKVPGISGAGIAKDLKPSAPHNRAKKRRRSNIAARKRRQSSPADATIYSVVSSPLKPSHSSSVKVEPLFGAAPQTRTKVNVRVDTFRAKDRQHPTRPRCGKRKARAQKSHRKLVLSECYFSGASRSPELDKEYQRCLTERYRRQAKARGNISKRLEHSKSESENVGPCRARELPGDDEYSGALFKPLRTCSGRCRETERCDAKEIRRIQPKLRAIQMTSTAHRLSWETVGTALASGIESLVAAMASQSKSMAVSTTAIRARFAAEIANACISAGLASVQRSLSKNGVFDPSIKFGRRFCLSEQSSAKSCGVTEQDVPTYERKNDSVECKSQAQLLLRSSDTKEYMKNESLVLGFVPRLELERLKYSDNKSITEPTCFSFSAAVMFCDISGFTALTENLTNSPDVESGAEVLTEILNEFFDALIAVIESFGGDVVKFCGDAILVIFTNSDCQTKLTILASKCALAIQDEFAHYEVDMPSLLEERVSFSLHMGIGVGLCHNMYVGGMFERWEMVFAGSPMVQIKTATSDAKPGECVLSPEAWRLIAPMATGVAKTPTVRLACKQNKHRKANVLLVSISDTASHLLREAVGCIPGSIDASVLDSSTIMAARKYVPGAVVLRLFKGQSWTEISELRRVTVLFFNCPALEVLHAKDLKDLQAVASVVQSSLYLFEGSVNKFLVDDKGSTLIGAFGLPPLAHEDDSVRGLQCGLLVRSRMKELGFPCSIGVTTGMIFCGVLGGSTRCEYAIMGDTVNTSARLMQHSSPDGFLCDEPTVKLSSSWLEGKGIRCRVVEPIRVKGKAHRIVVYEPREHKTKDGDIRGWQERFIMKTELVGRDRELTTLTKVSDIFMRDGFASSLCVWIEGDPGMGKSEMVKALYAHMYDASEMSAIDCVVSCADALETKTTYFVWRAILTQLLHLDANRQIQRRLSNLDATNQSRRLEEHVISLLSHLDPKFVQLAVLLNVVLPVAFSETELSITLESQRRAALRQEMLVEIMASFAQTRKIMVVIEDCQWLDYTSWILLEAAQDRVRPLLVVGTCRSTIHSKPLTSLSRPSFCPTPAHNTSGSASSDFVRTNTAPDLLAARQQMKRSAGSKRRNRGRRLSSLIDRSHNSAVVLSDDIRNIYERIRVLPGTTSIFLDEMDASSICKLVASKLGVHDARVPSLVLEIVDHRSRGNPFDIIEVIGHLQHKGYISIAERPDGTSDIVIREGISSEDDIDFPESVRGLITERLDALENLSEQMVLKAASVIGRIFDVDTLSKVVSSLDFDRPPEFKVIEVLNTLSEKTFVTYHGMNDSGCDEFQFEMEIIKDVAYKMMSLAHRQRIHAEIAHYIETVHADSLPKYFIRLANHHKKANNLTKAIEYLSKAAKMALANHALEDTIDLYTNALAIYERCEDIKRRIVDIRCRSIDNPSGNVDDSIAFSRPNGYRGRSSSSNGRQEVKRNDDGYDSDSGVLDSTPLKSSAAMPKSVRRCRRRLSGVSFDARQTPSTSIAGDENLVDAGFGVDALTLSVNTLEVATWHANLGEALTNLGDTINAKRHIEMALEIRDRSFPSTASETKCRLVEEAIRHRLLNKRMERQRRKSFEYRVAINSNISVQSGAGGISAPLSRAAFGSALIMEEKQAIQTLELSRLYLFMSRLTYFSGDNDAQNFCILRALNLSRKAGRASGTLAKAYAAACLTASSLSLHHKAEKFATEALVLTEACNDNEASLYVLLITSVFLIGHGKPVAADEGLVKAMLLASKLGNARRWEEAANMRGFVAFALGNYRQGSNILSKATKSAKSRSDYQMHARLALNLSGCLIQQCRCSEATDLLFVKENATDFFARLLHNRLDEVELMVANKSIKNSDATKALLKAQQAVVAYLAEDIDAALSHVCVAVDALTSIKQHTQVSPFLSFCFSVDVLITLRLREFAIVTICNDGETAHQARPSNIDEVLVRCLGCFGNFSHHFLGFRARYTSSVARYALTIGLVDEAMKLFQASIRDAECQALEHDTLVAKGWLEVSRGEFGSSIIKECVAALREAAWTTKLLLESAKYFEQSTKSSGALIPQLTINDAPAKFVTNCLDAFC